MKKAHKFQIFKNSDKMKQNISQNIDSGRSMVEMLGVLAVIGVLSVASILGYRFAMAKWRANETVNELNIRAYDIATRFDKLVASNTREIEMEMGDTTRLGYPITARISPQYVDYFEMFVSNVPTDVCKELLNSQWQAPYSIFVGIEEYEASSDICEQAENVQLAYEFYKDLSDRDEIPEEVQHKIQRCNHKNNCLCGTCNTETKLCETDCKSNQSCKRSYDNPNEYVCCYTPNISDKLCCSNETDSNMCCTEDYKCCPKNKPLRDNDGNCYACDDPTVINMSKQPQNCSLCPNRVLKSNYCALPCGLKGTVTENKPITNWKGDCFSCDEPNNFFVSKAEDCACEKKYVFKNAYGLICSMCGVARTPMADKPLNSYDASECRSCDTTEKVQQSLATDSPYLCQKVCSNREYINSRCVRKTCSTGYFEDISGPCQKCNIATPIAVKDEEACKVCLNRTYKDGYCTLNE